jgi:hypothetical protein
MSSESSPRRFLDGYLIKTAYPKDIKYLFLIWFMIDAGDKY